MYEFLWKVSKKSISTSNDLFKVKGQIKGQLFYLTFYANICINKSCREFYLL